MAITFAYAASFDTADRTSINDAFEAVLLDAAGNQLVRSYASQRDALFNLTEELVPAMGPETSFQSAPQRDEVTVDISSLRPDTAGTLSFRLVNNDSDTETTVEIFSVEVTSRQPDVAPTVTVELQNDTAPVVAGVEAFRNDRLTNDTRLRGTASDDHGIATVTVAIDGAAATDITLSLVNGRYVFDPGPLSPGSHQVVVRATDTMGQTSEALLDFTVNTPPIAEAGGDRSISEGGIIAFDATSSTDNEGAIFAYDWIFDDGTMASGPSTSHQYVQDGLYPVTLQVTDTAGSLVSKTVEVAVANLPPVVETTPRIEGDEGQQLQLEATFVDPGVLDTHNAVISWGDGATTAATITEKDGAGSVNAQHAYGDNAAYTITVSVTDDGQATSTREVDATIHNALPVVSITGPEQARRGDLITFTLAAIETSVADQQYDYMYFVDWDGDSMVDQTVVGPAGNVEIQHSFETVGTVSVRIYAMDKDEGAGPDAIFTLDILEREDSNSIGGYVYADVNNDGVKQESEDGLPNVVVTLTGPEQRTTVTAYDGAYRFDALPPGTYELAETHPAAFQDGWETQGNPTIGSVENDRFAGLVLEGGINAADYNFGERGLRADLVTKRLLLTSTPPTDEWVQQIMIADDGGWFSFDAPQTGTLVVSLPEDVGEPLIEFYGDAMVPLALNRQGWETTTDVIKDSAYVVHLEAQSGEGEFPATIRVVPGTTCLTASRFNSLDVNGDGFVAPMDALILIDALNRDGSSSQFAANNCLDVDGDGLLAPIDVLYVINELNRRHTHANITTGQGALSGAAFQVGEAEGGGPLVLAIAAPNEGAAFQPFSTILISGTVAASKTPSAVRSVTLDGVRVTTIDQSGNFFTEVTVLPGENVFQFMATDSTGQTAAKSLTLWGQETAEGELDFSQLEDVSASFTAEYGRTSFNETADTLYADMAVRNVGQYLADTPFLVGIARISDPSVSVLQPDGHAPDGMPYYDYSDAVAAGSLDPGNITSERVLAFFNPERIQFTYDLVFLARLNESPTITAAPDVEALADRPYRHHAAATDLGGDALSYLLDEGPHGMTIDPGTGEIAWDPTAADVGSHTVAVRVDDGRGGSDSQRYTLWVRENVPNRPAVFTSVPVVDGAVNTPYVYQVTTKDDDSDQLAYSLTDGPSGMTVDPDTGLVQWTPDGSQTGLQPVTIEVDDGQGGSTEQTFPINVAPEPGNHPPVITSDPVTRMAIALPGSPQGTVDPLLIRTPTGMEQQHTVSVTLPPPPGLGEIDLAAGPVDTSALVSDDQTLIVSRVLSTEISNFGATEFDSNRMGPFEVAVFEDSNGNGTFEDGVDKVLGRATFLGTIPGGGSARVEIDVAGMLRFAGSPLHVVADSGDVIPEADEQNNYANTGQASTYQPPVGEFQPIVEWQWDSERPVAGVTHPPVVAPLIDTNGDGAINERDVPAVVVATTGNQLAGQTNELVALRGDTGEVIFAVPNPQSGGGWASSGHTPTVGDIDGDGSPEILLSSLFRSPLYAFNNDGTLKWEFDNRSVLDTSYSNVVLADLDGDGTSEILQGTAIVNSDGTLRAQLNLPRGFFDGASGGSLQVADLDLDGIPEIINGPSAYDRDGNMIWGYNSTTLAFPPNLRPWYSWTAVADLDTDPYPEIIAVSDQTDGGGSTRALALTIFEHNGQIHAGPFGLFEGVLNESTYTLGPPTVADFDGDGQPEIAIAVQKRLNSPTAADFNRTILNVYESDGSLVWQKDLTLGFGGQFAPAASAFDFDGDGASELVYLDVQKLTIFNGSDGARLYEIGVDRLNDGWGAARYPTIADVDNDGDAEIVVPTYGGYRAGAPLRTGVLVLGDALGNWIHARRIWNQWLYDVTNIDEDAGVPATARNSWALNNSTREQVPIEGLDPFAAPDLSVSNVVIDAASCPGSVDLVARIGNGGNLQAGAGVPVHFYLGDPAAGGTLIGEVLTSEVLFPGQFEDVVLPWTSPQAGQVFVVVNRPPADDPIPSSNLSLLPHTWAQSSGLLRNAIGAVNGLAYSGIDDNNNSAWFEPGADIDPQPSYYEVHFPFPVNASSVTVENNSLPTTGFREGELTFSNGFSTTAKFDEQGEGTIVFPEQTDITWIRLTASVVNQDGARLTEFIVGGSYTEPLFVLHEGQGRDGNNQAMSAVSLPPCDPAGNVAPIVEAGADLRAFAGDTVSLGSAAFLDAGLLGTHTATIDWGDGSPAEPGTVDEHLGSGTVASSHTFATESTYNITVTVTDDAGNSGSDTVTLTVLDPVFRQDPIDVTSSDPSISFVNLTGPVGGIGPSQTATFDVRITAPDTPQSFDLLFAHTLSGLLRGSIPVVANHDYTYPAQAMDADGDPITFTLPEAPAGATIDPASGRVAWQPETPGTYDFAVQADDGRGGVARQAFQLIVSTGQANGDPTITSTAPAEAVARRDFSYAVGATDPDGDALSFFLTVAPAGMAIDTTAGVVSWTPDFLQIGTHPVTVEVRDGRGGQAAQHFDLDVKPDLANNSPEITSTAPLIAQAGLLYRYDVTATDADGDRLSFDLPLKPPGVAVNAATGVLTWTPQDVQIGIHDIIVRVRDGHQGVDLQAFQLNVRGPNTAPVITSNPPAQAVVDKPLDYRVRVQDAEKDPIQARLDQSPAGMTIDPDTGRVQWTPTSSQVGSQPVIVTLTDDFGGETEQTFTIDVVAAAPNTDPQISSTPRATIHLGGRYFYEVQAVDADFDPLAFSLSTAPAGMEVDAGGLVSWEPAASQLGTNQVELVVDDGRGGTATQPFAVEVTSQPSNQSPVIVSTPRVSTTVGRSYAYDVQAVDLDGDPLLFDLDDAPAGMSIDGQLGTIRWTPTSSQVGSHRVAIRVIDAQGGSDTQRYRIAVRAVNTPPQILSVPLTEAVADGAYTYAVAADDVDGDPLEYTLTSAPAGMTIDSGRGVIQWTPDSTQAGSHDVAIVADDGQGGTARQDYTVVVSIVPPNEPPVITSAPGLAATADRPYQYQVTADDPEGQAVEFELLQAPAGMTIGSTTGLIEWTPAADQKGLRPVVLTARDSQGASALQTFGVFVYETNGAPEITSTAPGAVAAGGTYRYDVQVTDPDGDPITYRLDTAPAGMTVDSLGRVRWSPGLGDAGTYPVALRVADNRGLSDTETFDLVVGPDNQAPLVDLLISEHSVNIGDSVTIVVNAVDDMRVESLELTLEGMPVGLDPTGRATVEMTQAGSLDVVARATDPAGNVGTAADMVVVIDTTITGPPVLEITSPADGDTITSPSDIIGTVEDDFLVEYVLSYAPLEGGSLVELARGTDPVTDGLLATFDPTLLPNDSYILQLWAIDAGNNESTIQQTVNVAGNLKLGNFTLSFSDLAVNVSGVPIQVIRTYDTLDATANGDFGFGWRLDYRDARLRTSVSKTGYEEYGIYHPWSVGTKVYITLPGGRREGFTFWPKLRNEWLRGQVAQMYLPDFRPDPGVTSELTVPDWDIFVLRQDPSRFTGILRGDEVVAASSVPYNPSDITYGGKYTLTTKDGVEYEINGFTGLVDRVTDPNGNTLTFTDREVASSTGKRVVIERDPRNRVTAVIDPAGNRIAYEYDGNGDLVSVTDREGNMTRFTYRTDHTHYLEEVIDPLGRTGVRTEYDDQGRMVRMFDGAGNPITMNWDTENDVQTTFDANGNRTIFEYDDRGNVLRQVDALGGVTKYTVDENDNTTSMTDPLGHTTTTTYDERGNPLTTTDPLGNTSRATYDGRGQLMANVDPLGNVTSYERDGRGNVTEYTDANGAPYEVSYVGGNPSSAVFPDGGTLMGELNAAGHVTRRVNGEGNVIERTYDANYRVLSETVYRMINGVVTAVTTRFEYDSEGRRIAEIYPDATPDDPADNPRKTWEYDPLGRVLAVTDELGRRTAHEYDASGRKTKTTYPDTNFESWAYDAQGNLLSYTDQSGRVTRHQYDALNRRVKTILPDDTPSDLTDNPVAETVYDSAGNVIAEIDALGRRTDYEYDAAGRRVRVISPEVVDATTGVPTRPEFTYQFDPLGRMLSATDPAGSRIRFQYDPLGNPIGVVRGDGGRGENQVDAMNRIVQRTDAVGNTVSYTYDHRGLLTSVTYPAGRGGATEATWNYRYDEAGLLVESTDPMNRSTSFEYDVRGRLASKTLPGGQRQFFEYDAAGNLIRQLDYSGHETTFEYDEMDRMVRRCDAEGNEQVWTYTSTGKLGTVQTPIGIASYTYDTLDRVISVNDEFGQTIEYEYDAVGNRTAVISPEGRALYTYDALNRLATVTDPDLNVATYGYDVIGNLVETVLPDGSVETRQYDVAHRLIGARSKDAIGQSLSSFVYTLDAAGNRIAVEEAGGRRVDYEYDRSYRLLRETISESGGSQRTIDYAYDLAGNRLERKDSSGATTTYEYDENDQLIRETTGTVVSTYEYDANGSLTRKVLSTGDQTAYTYDSLGRMTAVDILAGGGQSKIEYMYDHQGLLIGRTVDGQETRFLLDAQRSFPEIIEERTPGGVITAFNVHGWDLISQKHSGGTSIYHYDGLGSTRLLTDLSGAVTDTYRYDAFGRRLASSGTTSNVYLFAGERRDQATGLDYLRARSMDPSTGRFLSRDPFTGDVEFPLTLHPYQYASANPVNLIDPSGRFSLIEVMSALGIQDILQSINTAYRASTVCRFNAVARILETTLNLGALGVSLATNIPELVGRVTGTNAGASPLGYSWSYGWENPSKASGTLESIKAKLSPTLSGQPNLKLEIEIKQRDGNSGQVAIQIAPPSWSDFQAAFGTEVKLITFNACALPVAEVSAAGSGGYSQKDGAFLEGGFKIAALKGLFGFDIPIARLSGSPPSLKWFPGRAEPK